MSKKVVTKTRNAIITVTGIFATDTQTTVKDIRKTLIKHRLMSEYNLDLSGIQSEYDERAKEVILNRTASAFRR